MERFHFFLLPVYKCTERSLKELLGFEMRVGGREFRALRCPDPIPVVRGSGVSFSAE